MASAAWGSQINLWKLSGFLIPNDFATCCACSI